MTGIRIVLAVLLCALLGLPACAARRDPVDVLMEARFAAPETTPLGGDSLASRERELRRAQGDMLHFLATLESMQYRRDRSGAHLFKGFMNAYLGTHLEPLLSGEWPSDHPELIGVDANLRLLRAEALAHLREPGRMQQALNEIEQRFGGRMDMLVNYPVGRQSTLGEALEHLRRRKWRG